MHPTLLRTAQYSLLIIVLALFSGCATTALTPDEKSQIRTLSVVSNLGQELEYVKLGTTVFQNHNDTVPGEELLSQLRSSVQSLLQARGYAITNDPASADAILKLEPGTSSNYPSNAGVTGAGFFVHSVFGINPGIQAQALILFRLEDPKTGKVRAHAPIHRLQLTPVKKAPAKWMELSEEERRTLLEVLQAQLQTVPEEGVNKLGL